MASTHIELVSNEPNRHAQDLARFVRRLNEAKAEYNQIRGRLVAASSGSDWAGLAALLNMTDQADAQEVFNLLVAVDPVINGSAIGDVLGRLG